MSDISLNTNGTGGVGDSSAANDGLMDAPAKSPLEQSAAAQPTAPLDPVASSAMPGANLPAAEVGAPPAAPAPQEETAGVPDTDKFLESILDNSNQGQPAASSPAADASTSQTPAPEPHDDQGGVSVGINGASPEPVDSAPPVVENSPVAPFPAEQSPDDQPKIKDDIRGLDTVMNGITPPNEPSKPISDNPIGAMQAQKSSGGSMKTILLIVLLIALGIGGYFVYTTMFAPKTTELPPLPGDASGLTSPVAPGSTQATTLSNDDTRKQDLAKIHVALKSYFSATGKYPLSSERLPLNTPNNILEKELVGASYINAIPADPDQGKYYAYKSDGATFSLTAVLDSASDPEAKVDGSMAIYEINQDSVLTTSPNSVPVPFAPGATDQADTTVSTDSTGSDTSLNPFYPAGSSTVTTESSSSTGATDSTVPIL